MPEPRQPKRTGGRHDAFLVASRRKRRRGPHSPKRAPPSKHLHRGEKILYGLAAKFDGRDEPLLLPAQSPASGSDRSTLLPSKLKLTYSSEGAAYPSPLG